MGKLEDFLGPASSEPQGRPDGVEWYAAAQCQVCGKPVDQQTLYPNDYLLVWECDAGHRSYIEGYTAF